MPQAELVHDKFHVAKHLNEAGSPVHRPPLFPSASSVDTVRRQEHKELLAQGDETLKSTRQLWLFNPVNFSDEQAADFERLKYSGLKVARAWASRNSSASCGLIATRAPPASSSKTGSGGPPAANSNPSSRRPE